MCNCCESCHQGQSLRGWHISVSFQISFLLPQESLLEIPCMSWLLATKSASIEAEKKRTYFWFMMMIRYFKKKMLYLTSLPSELYIRNDFSREGMGFLSDLNSHSHSACPDVWPEKRSLRPPWNRKKDNPVFFVLMSTLSNLTTLCKLSFHETHGLLSHVVY